MIRTRKGSWGVILDKSNIIVFQQIMDRISKFSFGNFWFLELCGIWVFKVFGYEIQFEGWKIFQNIYRIK